MAPKRKQGGTSAQANQPTLVRVNRNRFSNAEAQMFYDQNLDKREGAERGFIWLHENYNVREAQLQAFQAMNNVKQQVAELGWDEFGKHPSEGNIMIAREFYVNLFAANEEGVFVRGERVPIDSGSINALFGLPDTDGFFEFVRPSEDDDEIEMIEGQNAFRKPTDAEIVETLCNSSFRHNPHLNLSSQLRTSHLTLESKVWYYFTTARLIPTKGGRKLGAPRIMLLYCIMKKIPVNVGKIIRNNIYKTRRTAPFIVNFPITITALCERAKIRGDGSEKIPPRLPFNFHYFSAELTKVLEKEREARENPDRAIVPDAPRDVHHWDMWLAHQQTMAETGYTQMMLSIVMEALNIPIPPRPAVHPGFEPPAGRHDAHDDMEEND